MNFKPIDKTLFSLIFFGSVLSICVFACAAKNATIEPPYQAEKITYRNQSFDIVSVNDVKQLRFFWKDEKAKRYRSLSSLRKKLEDKNQTLQFAMNGGMYLKDGSPQGLYIEAGKTLTPADTVQEAYGNFYLQPNGIFYLSDTNAVVLPTTSFLAQNPNVNYATQSGPMLVIDNELHPVFREGSPNVHIRNGVGVRSDGTIFFAISNERVNLYDFAMLFKEKLACPSALYLDGFVSKAYIPSLERSETGGNFGVIIGLVKTR